MNISLSQASEQIGRAFSSLWASPKKTINDKLKSLRYPMPDMQDFPIYDGDKWMGIPDFQGNVCGGIYMGKKGNLFEWHSHPFHEYGHVFSGQCILHVAGRGKKLYRSGESFFIPGSTSERDTAHSCQWIEDWVIVFRWEPPLDGQWVWDVPENPDFFRNIEFSKILAGRNFFLKKKK